MKGIITTKKMKKDIIEKYNGIPERQIRAGLYLESVGSKYVTILNTWDTTRLQKELIEDFWFSNCY